MHVNLRMALLIKEFKKRAHSPGDVVIGAPVAPEEIAERGSDRKALMDFLRMRAYQLSPGPIASGEYGHEFEQKHRA